jgi:two-component system, sensor histidine kinase and response regulator
MKTILIVEDEEDVRLNLKDLLEAESYNVLTASNGREAYILALENLPDLIISDIKMPEMDGIELYKHLGEHTKTSSIPFIYLTAKVDYIDVRKGMSIGADDYIEKPFKIEDVLVSIDARLKKRELLQGEINSLKDKLLKKIPHELRTPLVAIMGFTELIEQDIDSLTKDELRGMASKIRKSSRRLHRRVEKFLNYAEIVAEEKELKGKSEKSFYIYSVYQDFISHQLKHTIEDYERSNDVIIKFESADIIINDMYFEIILKELVENALKFSQAGSPVKITGISSGNYYKTKIEDHGVGIPPNSVNRINTLTQLSDFDEFNEGLGLGLALVQKILILNNGYLTAQTTKRKNTIVEFGVPLKK